MKISDLSQKNISLCCESSFSQKQNKLNVLNRYRVSKANIEPRISDSTSLGIRGLS